MYFLAKAGKRKRFELDACLYYKAGCFSFRYFETWGHFQEQISQPQLK